MNVDLVPVESRKEMISGGLSLEVTFCKGEATRTTTIIPSKGNKGRPLFAKKKKKPDDAIYY